MKLLIAVALASLVSLPALAAECPLEGATYADAASGWTLQFTALPQGSAANQLAAFSVATTGMDGTIEGGVYVPNGYGRPMVDIGRNCPNLDDEAEVEAPADGAEETSCSIWSGAIYGLSAGSMGRLAYDEDSFRVLDAPNQLLLPDLGLTMWYSEFRDAVFGADKDLSDVFTRTACGTK